MGWRQQINERGMVTGYRDTDTHETISLKEYERRMQMQSGMPAGTLQAGAYPGQTYGGYPQGGEGRVLLGPTGQAVISGQGGYPGGQPMASPYAPPLGSVPAMAPAQVNPFVQPGAQMLSPGMQSPAMPMQQGMQPQGMQQQGLAQPGMSQSGMSQPGMPQPGYAPAGTGAPGLAQQGVAPMGSESSPMPVHGKSLRMEGIPHHQTGSSMGRHGKGFLDATSIAILMPTLVLLALIIAAAHKKRLFPWQTIRTFNPPSGLMTPRDYERSYVCPPNGRRHGRLGKKNPQATWSEADGVVIPFGFLARTHLPVTIPMGRLPNKNMFIVAPSGSGKTTLMRAVIKALLAKPCVIIALEAKANDPNLDEKREGFKYTVLPEAQHAGFRTLYFNPLDSESIHWNPLDLDANTFASSIVQDINSLDAEEQHWAERDMGYIEGLSQLLKWGAVQVMGEDENGQAAQLEPLPCNPYGLMKLVNNRRNIVESMRRLKNDPNINAGELSELTQRLSSIIRTDSDWDKNIQGVRGRLRMFKNQQILRVTHQSNVDVKGCMHEPTVLIFGAPASLGPDAESLAACFVYQLQQALHTRYGTKSVLPLFAFFDEYQTLNIDLAGRLSAIVRGANGGLTVILQNISQIEGGGTAPSAELRTIFSNSAVRVCLHNADEITAKFFSEEIGKHAVVVPGIADHFQANGFGIFPTSWNRIHSQQVVARVDTDSIKRMEKHHALVYLSPAGDPEFGETKPFMCDLRGIEEIAKLHLLHNVNARRQTAPPDNSALPQPVPGGPGGFVGGGGAPGFAQPQSIFDMTGGPAPGSQPAPAGSVDPVPGYGQPVPANPAYGQAAYGQPIPANPAYGQPVPAAPAVAQAANAQPQVPTNGNGSQGASSPADAGPRLCGACGKPAGKGKFCIECGQFIGAAPQAVEMSTSARVLDPQQPMTPPGGGIIPSFAETQNQSAPSPVAAVQPQGPVDSFGNPMPVGLSATSTPSATPRYGGLAPQSRDAMPSKRGLFEGASQIAETAQQVLQGQMESGQRRPVTSLSPDPAASASQEKKRKPGVEF